ncbi:hypothetical protein K8Q93_02705 [Candidatus Parcubacteria bacterium]|nr:hypothetical protein [Candidatus Parcubacteria bacterium]
MYGLTLDSLEHLLVPGLQSPALGDDPRHELVRTIQASMEEVELRQSLWHEVIEACRRMRTFTIDADPKFELRLDYTTHQDRWGQTKHAKICVDGVLAFYLYYGERHVLTIGYSIAPGKKVMIGNVQAPKETKGWGLQFLPRERLEYVITLFQKTFDGYEVYLANGEDLVKRLIQDYERELLQARADLEQAGSPEEKETARRWCDEFEKCIAQMANNRARIEELYRRTGRFKLGETREFHSLKYHLIEE